MTPVIYADTLFLYNFLMDSVILIITARLINKKVHILKIILGAVLGGVYSVLMFFPSVKILYSLILKTAILFGIFYFVFGGNSVYRTIKNFASFILVNLTLGGCIYALIFLTDFGISVGSVVSGGEIYMNLSPIILIFGIGGTYLFLGIYQKVQNRALYEKSLIKRIKIEYKCKTAEVNVLLDTGCRICDPVTDRPAMIVELKRLELILSEKERAIICDRADFGTAYEKGLRVLNVSTVSGEKEIYGIVADKICGENFEAEKVTVGITEEIINENYGGIINPEIIAQNKINAEECLV